MSGSLGRLGGIGVGAISTTGANVYDTNEGPVIGPKASTPIAAVSSVARANPLTFNPHTLAHRGLSPFKRNDFS